MKESLCIFLLLVILIGCSRQTQQEPSGSITRITTYTKQPQEKLTRTATPLILSTLLTKTASAYPSQKPTLGSTPTSNFQNIKIPVFTHAPPALCPPKSRLEIALPMTLPEDEANFQKLILDILNAGGAQKLLERLPDYRYVKFRYADLTNDGIKELILNNPTLGGNLYVFGCKNGEFENLLTVSRVYDYGPEILAIKDINRDRVNELIISLLTCHYCTGMEVYEWNGHSFESLIRDWYINHDTNKLEYYSVAELDGYSYASIRDIDNDGIYELILEGGIPSYLSALTGWEGPWRGQEVVYRWNGQFYVWYSQKYNPPNFRFEAIQDGDIKTLRGNYDAAINSYRAAIFNEKLRSWNKEIWQKQLQLQEEGIGNGYPDIQKMPFDQTEYDQLSAYARFRIMIVYINRGLENDAEIIYRSLLSKFREDSPGHPYAEMASEFWNEYQLSHDPAQSCDKAILYATLHAEILAPLGSHGGWDDSYEPKSVCPFE
jgi:hypothetical protein